jgi:hypothetical protein
MQILFLHGWASTPGGLKPTYLKNHGHEVVNPALPDNDFDEAIIGPCPLAGGSSARMESAAKSAVS